MELTVRVHHEGTDGLWAEVIELPGCFASGDTFEELQEAVAEAVALYLDAPIRPGEWQPIGSTEDHRVLVA